MEMNINKQQCEHNRRKARCKECKGGSICSHDKEKYRCKECKGGGICSHDKQKSSCKECKGSSICIHDKRRSSCKECKGSSICIHDKKRSYCKECEGTSICNHDKIRSICKECKGSSICIHDKIRSRCKQCKGGSICIHDKERSICKQCDLIGYIKSICSSRIRTAFKLEGTQKTQKTIEYLGCNILQLREHLETQFTEGMTWERMGVEIHIDHKIPIKYGNPTMEEVIKRLHYTNLQPMWAKDNISKGNRFISL